MSPNPHWFEIYAKPARFAACRYVMTTRLMRTDPSPDTKDGLLLLLLARNARRTPTIEDAKAWAGSQPRVQLRGTGNNFETLRGPEFPPCSSIRATAVPSGDGWMHEVKFDGYRVQVHKGWLVVTAYSHHGHNFTARFPSVVWAVMSAA
jgi:ATP-dependent DNA ligase